MEPLIVVLGPTGSGKSDLGLYLAERFGGDIVNYDSIQVYRGLDIGSAKTPVAQRRGIKHWVFDTQDIHQELSAGEYSRVARQAISQIHALHRVPILVGGTGFYLKALIDGLSPAPGRNEPIRARLAKTAVRKPEALQRFLRSLDPASASRIHMNDHQKLIRAIELTVLARQPASKTQSLPRDGLTGVEILKLGLAPDRGRLYRKLDERSAWLFSSGLLAETRQLLEQGYSINSKPLQSLGYKQAIKVISGDLSLKEAILECQTRTRQYAKRQMTWFRGETNVHWLSGFGYEEHIQSTAASYVTKFLKDVTPQNM